MFSMTIEYALRAAIYLTGSRHRRVTAQVIAGECRVPVSYMSKVLQAMAEAGLITSQRGPSGGFALARPADEITLLDVVDSIDPLSRRHESAHAGEEQANVLALLDVEMDTIRAMIISRLASRSLESLKSEPAEPLEIKVLVTDGDERRSETASPNRLGASLEMVDTDRPHKSKAMH